MGESVAQILAALEIAADRGLALPLVYNTGGYDSLPALELLDGVVDIYMPDFKYADAETARRYSGAEDYPEVAKAALREMHRQVGDLTLDGRGVARRGLLVRHLVLPNDLAGTAEVVAFLAQLSPLTYLNIMGQYRPTFQSHLYASLNRPVNNNTAAFRPAPKPATPQQSSFVPPEPTYHPISYGARSNTTDSTDKHYDA